MDKLDCMWGFVCKINALYRDILLLFDRNQHHVSQEHIIYVDLSKLSNLGTCQEIGEDYDETATERNILSKTLFSFMLNS